MPKNYKTSDGFALREVDVQTADSCCQRQPTGRCGDSATSWYWMLLSLLLGQSVTATASHEPGCGISVSLLLQFVCPRAPGGKLGNVSFFLCLLVSFFEHFCPGFRT